MKCNAQKSKNSILKKKKKLVTIFTTEKIW